MFWNNLKKINDIIKDNGHEIGWQLSVAIDSAASQVLIMAASGKY